MKNSEAVQAIDVKSMAEHFGLRQQSIKLAIVGPGTKDLTPLRYITTITHALHLYERSSRTGRRNDYLNIAVDLCNSWDDFRKVRVHIDQGQSILHGRFAISFQLFINDLAGKAQTFEELHEIWINLNDDYLAEENMKVFQLMLDHAVRTPVAEVARILYSDDADDWLGYGKDHCELLLCSAEAATPEQAKEALEFFHSIEWKGEESSVPVRTLIKKAAELYRK